MYVRIVS